jgi:hypothetical protein
MAMVLLLIMGGGGLLFVAYRAANAQKKRAAAKEQAVKAEQAVRMTEAERKEYLEKFVVVNDLQLVPDTKPDSDEPVPGLFRVTGIVHNQGEQHLDRIDLHVFPENASGDVIGAYIQNIAGPKGLGPGATRDFRFQVPEKKEYGGKFSHSVR